MKNSEDNQVEDLCYHCVAGWIETKLNDLKEMGFLKNGHAIFEMSPQMNLSTLLLHLNKLPEDKAFRTRGVIHALNEHEFLDDFHGAHGLFHQDLSVSEALLSQVELASFFVVTEPSTHSSQTREIIEQLRETSTFIDLKNFHNHFQEMEKNSFYEFTDLKKNIRCFQILQQQRQNKAGGTLHLQTNHFHPDRFAEIVNKWPEGVIRSYGYVWIAEEEPNLYRFSQIGKETASLTRACTGCASNITAGLQEKSCLALVGNCTRSLNETIEALKWASLSEWEKKIFNKNKRACS